MNALLLIYHVDSAAAQARGQLTGRKVETGHLYLETGLLMEVSGEDKRSQ